MTAVFRQDASERQPPDPPPIRETDLAGLTTTARVCRYAGLSLKRQLHLFRRTGSQVADNVFCTLIRLINLQHLPQNGFKPGR